MRRDQGCIRGRRVTDSPSFDRRAGLLAVLAIALAGCGTLGDVFKFESPASSPSAYGAVFAPTNGSVAGGGVRIIPRDDGIALNIYVTGLPPGRFRVAFHANGNCSSPNAFSAGPPWSPPGVEPALLSLAASSDGGATLSVRLRGYKLEGADGLLGKAVVLHEGGGSLDARPDVPNGRLACGVIGVQRTLSF
jgi:superoxide dismutase, Cu-Zn family